MLSPEGMQDEATSDCQAPRPHSGSTAVFLTWTRVEGLLEQEVTRGLLADTPGSLHIPNPNVDNNVDKTLRAAPGAARKLLILLVGTAGFEPATP